MGTFNNNVFITPISGIMSNVFLADCLCRRGLSVAVFSLYLYFFYLMMVNMYDQII
jgi:hypothetical protein